MPENTIGREAVKRILLVLFDEGYAGSQGKGTWYIDNEPGCGLLGTIARLDAPAASRPLSPEEPLTAASHVEHVRFALFLANRAAHGENPYPTADWSGSWAVRSVDAAAWIALRESLEKEIGALRDALTSGNALEDEDFLTGCFGLVAHTAWHLGALRQGLGLIRAPGRS